MLLFRSLVVGLLGACCLLLAMQRPPQVVFASAPVTPAFGAFLPPDPRSPPSPAVTVIDVAPGVTGELLAQMIVLAANEHIIAINDTPLADPRAALEALMLESRQYVDVSIASDAGGARRVLVLSRGAL